MPKVQILVIKKVKLDSGKFKHVLPPETGFKIIVDLDKNQQAVLDDRKALKAMEAVAAKFYKGFLIQAHKRLQKFDKLFAGMLDKGAAEAVVAKQVAALKKALENETPKWEKVAGKEVMAALKKLESKKR